MPGNYKRTSTRHLWMKEDMAAAIEAIREQRMGWLSAAKRFNVPQATLRRHFHNSPANLGRYKPTFTTEMEKELTDHILQLEGRLFGLTTTDVRRLAYQLAVKLGIQHRFDHSTKMAGWDWLKGFKDRNPSLTLRSPEPTSAARAKAFNKPQVMKFYALLEKIITEEKIAPQRIYNMDESGLSTVQKPPKVFALKGKKQVGAVTSAERGEHVTVAVCANAIGNLVPPTLIMPRKNHKNEYFEGAPPGTLELCYETGYMVGELFHKWMKHFVASVGCNPDNKALLILDGHGSHKHLETLEYAKANGVILLCLPPHCTHRMQPLDVSFFGPLETYYDNELTTWMRNHPGRTVGLYQVAAIFGRAYGNAASVRNITSGFQSAGIYPFNPNIFPEHLFLPAEVTENDLEMEHEASPALPRQHLHDINLRRGDEPDEVIPQPNENEPARANRSAQSTNSPEPSTSVAVISSGTSSPSTKGILKVLSPMPRSVSTGKPRKPKKKGFGSQVLTSSPFINEVKAQIQTKKDKENKRNVRARTQIKRGIFNDDEEEEPFTQDNEADVNDDDAACIYCNELYSKSRPGEHWLRCQSCSRWCHALCAGASPRAKQFICELCA